MLESRILYEDNHLICVNKLCGEIVQGDKSGDIPLLHHVKEYLAKKYGKTGNVFLGLPHRIDRPTSGLVVFAKTSKALSRMNALFRDTAAVKKTYWALVDACPEEEGKLEHYLRKNAKQNKSYVVSAQTNGAKLAVLTYKVLKQLDNYTLLEILLQTGRHHQIRAQLAAIGLHVKGDLKYGAKRSNADGGIHLHAREIEFIHPVLKTMLSLIADPPSEPLWDACRNS